MYGNFYGNQYQNVGQFQRTDLIRVNGQNGAQAYQMPPNSSALLLDSNLPVVYLKQTDGAGYASITAYDIVQHQEPKQADFNALESRISRLEALLNESNSPKIKQPDTT